MNLVNPILESCGMRLVNKGVVSLTCDNGPDLLPVKKTVDPICRGGFIQPQGIAKCSALIKPVKPLVVYALNFNDIEKIRMPVAASKLFVWKNHCVLLVPNHIHKNIEGGAFPACR